MFQKLKTPGILIGALSAALFMTQPSGLVAAPTFDLIAPMVDIEIGTRGMHASGFFIKPDTFVTARHVVEHFNDKEGDTPAKVTIIDSEGKEHTVKSVTPLEYTDAAIVTIEDTTSVPLASVGCYVPKPLDILIAAGNPLDLRNIVTPVFVAGYEKDGPDKQYGGPRIIVSGTVVMGMSGGPVFDNTGHVVGIVSSEMAEVNEPGRFELADLNSIVPLKDLKEVCN